MKECPRCPACFDDSAVECPDDKSPLERSFPGEPVVDGKYRIESRLGRGGMGVVYRARHLGLDRSFALKLIRFPYAAAAGGRSFTERFEVEARDSTTARMTEALTPGMDSPRSHAWT